MEISAKSPICYQFKALTDLWTGLVNLVEQKGQIKEKIVSDRLITTGLLGSIRWWFEVLIRGLGGSACDSSDDKSRCPDKYGQRCVVCEFFGCTSWARKFRFEVLNKDGEIIIDQIRKDDELQLRFTPLRPIHIEEWTLLDTTLRLIVGYGAIGGKTVFKPTDESSRASRLHHKDFGLVKITTSQQFDGTGRDDLETYLFKWRKLDNGEFAWASLQHFWCVNGKYLGRQDNNKSTFNQVIGRSEPKQQSGQNHSWIAGRRPDRSNNIEAESKKVFSFKNPPRTFGFVKPGLIDFDPRPLFQGERRELFPMLSSRYSSRSLTRKCQAER